MRVLVLGTGSIGMRHVGVLGAIAGTEVVAVPVRPGRAAELRARGIAAVETLADGLALAPDGAVVATDTGRHADDAAACLAVCPVLVEKPLAPTAAEAARVVTAARAAGRAVHVACCLRFDDALAWARDRAEAVGAPRLVDVECLSWLPAWRPARDHLAAYSARPGEGGVLLDLIHDIDSCCWFAGPVREVTARIENRGVVGLPDDVDETASLVTRHAGGWSGAVRLSYAVRPQTRRLRLWGADGVVEWDGIARRARRANADGVEIESHVSAGADAMYRAQAEAWLASLGGAPSPRLVGGEQGAFEVAIVDAARRSAARGQPEVVAADSGAVAVAGLPA